MPDIEKLSDDRNCKLDSVSNTVKSYANDPYFVKKAEEARQTISKIGLPGDKKK